MPAPAEFRNDNDKKLEKLESKNESTGKKLDYLSNDEFTEIALQGKGNIFTISQALECSYNTLKAKIERTPEWEDIMKQSKLATIKWVESKHMELIEGVKVTDGINVYSRPPSMKAIEVFYKKEGLIIEKSENKNSNTNLDLTNELSNLSDDEIKAKLDKLMK